MAGKEIATRGGALQPRQSGGALSRPGERIPNVKVEGARILFRNFAGREGQYNRAGDRNFALVLPQDVAIQMQEDGWNIKFLRPREEGELPLPYVPVAVKYDGPRPPATYMITSRGRTPLGPDEIEILDWADLANVDVIIRPYAWSVSGNSGIKAYLKTLYATIQEDELELKYADVPDSAMSSIETFAVPFDGDDSDIDYAEIED